MIVSDLIQRLQQENPNAEVRWKLFWEHELDAFGAEDYPEQAFEEHFRKLLDVILVFHTDEEEE
jgi:hypothetical protein